MRFIPLAIAIVLIIWTERGIFNQFKPSLLPLLVIRLQYPMWVLVGARNAWPEAIALTFLLSAYALLLGWIGVKNALWASQRAEIEQDFSVLKKELTDARQLAEKIRMHQKDKCPIGLDCAAMGWQRYRCLNYDVCSRNR